MGVLDVINGMQNGPRGPSDPNTKGGMSPMTLAILGVLAYKRSNILPAAKRRRVRLLRRHHSARRRTPTSLAAGSAICSRVDLVACSQRRAGSVISGGLGDLLRQFQQSGHGDTANSWVSSGPNKPISVDDLTNVLGADQINTLIAQTGLSRDELLAGLSQHLPEVVNQLTPAGRLPNESEVSL